MLHLFYSKPLPFNTSYRKSSNLQFGWFNTKFGIMKFINTLIAVLYCFNDTEINNKLGVERLSSRACEQCFGQFRNHYCGNESESSAFAFAVRSALSLIFQYDLGIFFKIEKRDNFGGCHLNYIDKYSDYSFNQKINTFFTQKEIRNIAKNEFMVATSASYNWSVNTEEFLMELSTLVNKFSSSPKNKFSLRKGKKKNTSKNYRITKEIA